MSYTTNASSSFPDQPRGGAKATQSPSPDDGLRQDDEEFAELPPRRPIRWITQVAAVLVALCLAYTGGVLVQKGHDAKLTSATSAAPNLAAGGPGSAPGVQGPGSGSAASNPSSGPTVIGTITAVSKDSVTVTDLGGATHVVHLSGTTTITQSTALTASGLKPGATVSVDGSKSADGSVNATAVTTR